MNKTTAGAMKVAEKTRIQLPVELSEVPPPHQDASETERLLRLRIKVLEETVRERELLVAIISHEIRTPLTTIFGNAHLLQARLGDMDEDTRKGAINDIREEAERLNGLVENMLLLARSGVQETVSTSQIAVQGVLDEVASDHAKQFSGRVVVLDVKPKGLKAEGQRDYMKQVVQNLLGNAEKYSPADQPIDMQARLKGDRVEISILDRGDGVEPAESEIIFQAFYRGANTSSNVRGAGIGLSVCKLLVQAQSGWIWTKPRRGGGSVFAFSLPAAA